MSSKAEQQRGGTLREMSAPRRNKKLPDWIKIVTTFFFVVPVVVDFFYASGMWTPRKDSIDDIIVSGSVFCGLGGVILIHFVIKYLEDVRE